MMFAERLKELRKERKLTQLSFAKEFNIASGTIAMWETGKREPDFETTGRIAEFFNVSVDYLLGKTDIKEAPTKDGGRKAGDEDIKFALFGGSGEITDAMYEEVRNFAAYVKQREAEKKE